MKTSKMLNPISLQGRNHIFTTKIDNHKFVDEWEKNEFKRDVEGYAQMRIRQNRPQDNEKSLSAIRGEIYNNIYDHWKMLRDGYEFDFPITDLI